MTEDWEQAEIDSKPFANTNEGEEDWEEFDLDAVEKKQQEELKKKQEQQAELEKQEKLKKQQQKEKKKNERPVASPTAPTSGSGAENKKAEGMYLDYQEKKSSYDEAEALVGGGEFVKPKIDLLQPKTEKEFQEFGRLVAEKLCEFDESKYYMDLMRLIIEEATVNLDSAQLRDLAKHVTNVSNKRLEEEKERKGGKKKKKTNINLERDISSNADPFADLGDGTGGRTRYDDDDFM
ncbi:hypothetical protein FDP41_012585 [Naegleria fowleri]|uniref:Uncharacterized protein n=1 Tax=Naegleria fowleri TaxID=5763 RepID=A0A6A5C750_NAEFO|nr:uncharacterized protein FDP41_012585 [Naegleria fowleri]KAF0981325.1 hypothetical protein FDP41_012585 [Naegleria fowleri]CAG4708003.1 unnamed protein product [Naegleria fowleri]